MSKKVRSGYIAVIGLIIFAVVVGVLYNKYYKKEDKEKNLSKLHEKYFYLNLSKDVAYVGDEQCRSCHADITESFHKTGMGSSFYKPSGANEIEDFTKENIM